MKKQHFLCIFAFLLAVLPVFQSNAYIIENTQITAQTVISPKDTTSEKQYNIKPKNKQNSSPKQAKILKILKWSLAVVVAIAAVYYLQGTLWLLALTLAAILGYFLSKKIAEKNAEKQKERRERQNEQSEIPNTEQPSQKNDKNYGRKALTSSIAAALVFLLGLIILALVLSVSESVVLTILVLLSALSSIVLAILALVFAFKDFNTTKKLSLGSLLAIILSLSILGLPIILIFISLLGF